MPRFMGFVRMEENIGEPPQSLFGAMDAYIGELAANGVFIDGGGLYGTEDAVNFVVRQGEVTRVDGPYAEAKEVVGGWSLLEYPTLDPTVSDPHGVINQGHGNATGRAIQIYENDEIDRDAITGILSEIVDHNRQGGWRKLSGA